MTYSNMNFFRNVAVPSVVSGAGYALTGVLGNAVLPLFGVAAAGSISAVALPLFVGGAIVLMPHVVLHVALNAALDDKRYPIPSFLLRVGLHVGTAYAAAAIGAAIFGVAVNPLLLCLTAGVITLGLATLAVVGIASAIKAIGNHFSEGCEDNRSAMRPC